MYQCFVSSMKFIIPLTSMIMLVYSVPRPQLPDAVLDNPAHVAIHKLAGLPSPRQVHGTPAQKAAENQGAAAGGAATAGGLGGLGGLLGAKKGGGLLGGLLGAKKGGAAKGLLGGLLGGGAAFTSETAASSLANNVNNDENDNAGDDADADAEDAAGENNVQEANLSDRDSTIQTLKLMSTYNFDNEAEN